jgi:magnesium chelatase family protein
MTLLSQAAESARLTARGWRRRMKTARTIADLEGSTAVRRVHVAEALSYADALSSTGASAARATRATAAF